MKIRPVEAECFHADEQTERHDEASSRFRNFANTPKKKEATHNIDSYACSLNCIILHALHCIPAVYGLR
jgi:hypothetical protein